MKFRRRNRRPLRIDLTPLVDVVFLLLTFYMLTSTFSSDQGVSLNLPEAAASSVMPSEKIVVSIVNDESVEIEDQVVSLLEIRPTLQKFLKKGGTKPDVVVRAGKASSVQTLVYVLDEVKIAGVKSVSLATVPKSH